MLATDRLTRRLRHVTPPIFLTLAAALFTAATPAAADVNQIVKLLPADPAAFVVVPNLGQLDAKIIAFRDKLGLNPRDFPNPLEEFKNETGIQNGLDPNAPLVMVFPEIKGPNQDADAHGDHAGHDDWDHNEPDLLLIVPVTDFNAFVANFEGKPDGPVTALTMQHGEPGFAKQLNNHAVMGPRKETVAAYAPGMTVQALAQSIGPVGQHSVNKCDAYVVLNVAKMSPLIQAALDEMTREIDRELSRELPADGPEGTQNQLMQFGQAFLKMETDAARAFCRDASAIVWGADLSDQGIGFWGSVQFKPGSFSASIFPAGGGAASQLTKFANKSYLFAMAANLKGLNLAPLLDELSLRMKDLPANPYTASAVKSLEMVRPLEGMAAVYYPAGPEAAGQSFFNAVGLYQTPNSQGFIENLKGYFEELNKFSIAPPQEPAQQDPNAADDPNAQDDGGQEEGGQSNALTFSSNYTPAVMEIDGVKIDQYHTQMNLPPEMMMEMGPAAGMLSMLGLTQQSGFVAAKNDHVLVTTSTDPQFMKQSLLSLTQNQGLGTHQFITQQRAAALPPDPAMEFFISAPGLVQTANTFMMMFGQPALDVPEHLPPVSGALSVRNAGLLARFHVPMSVITYCVELPNEMARQQQQQQQGGQPRRQGGGPPPAPRS